MKKSKIVLLAVIQLCILSILFMIVHLGVAWLINEVLLSMFNWFNGRKLLLKIIIIIIGGLTLVKFIFAVAETISKLIGGIMSIWFPYNVVVVWISLIGMLTITIIDCVQIWKLPDEYDFWVVIEMILLCGLVGTVYHSLVPRDLVKEQEERLRQERINEMTESIMRGNRYE